MPIRLTSRLAAALRAAGIVPGPPRDLAAEYRRIDEGAAVVAGRPTSPPLPPGTLIVDFEVPIRPVPWSAPHTTRTGHAYKDKRLVAWQEEVARCARIAMGGRAPYPGPVRVSMRFYLSPRGGSPPDASNLGKGCEDALQGVVIVNDKKVVDVRSRRFRCRTDRAVIEVFAMEDL